MHNEVDRSKVDVDGMEPKTGQNQLTDDVNALSIHGIPKAFTGETRFSKIFWSIFCIISCATLLFLSTGSFVKYFDYKVFISMEKRKMSHFTLPAITFCQTNYYDPMLYAKDVPELKNFPENCSLTDHKYFANNISRDFFAIACRLFIGTRDAKTSGFDQVKPKYFLFPSNFSFVPHFYPCFTLKRNSHLKQNGIGEGHGLHMILYDENMSSHTFTHFYNATPLKERRQGITVHIHDPEIQVPIDDGVLVPAGFHTHIALQKSVVRRKPSPYPSKCKQSKENRGESFFPGKSTHLHCYHSCRMNFLYKHCPGVFFEYRGLMKPPKYPKVANYSEASFFRCVERVYDDFGDRNCNCNLLCDEEIYDVKVDRSTWPQDWQAPSLYHLLAVIENKSDSDSQDVRKRMARVSIYYSDAMENVIEENPLYDFTTIISDLGGQMGLFMGASLLSLVELVLLLLCFCRYRFFGHR